MNLLQLGDVDQGDLVVVLGFQGVDQGPRRINVDFYGNMVFSG